MQLNITTDYAIRTVLYLANRSKLASSSEISSAMKIPQNYIVILTRRLREAGILRTVRGKDGGYALNRNPCDITLYEIIVIMEGTLKINRCLEPDHYCSYQATEHCPVREKYQALQHLFEDFLTGITMESLLHNKRYLPSASNTSSPQVL